MIPTEIVLKPDSQQFKNIDPIKFAISKMKTIRRELWGVVGLYENVEELCHWWKSGHIKRECPRRPRGITKMWHMLEKLISLIFRPDIPHDELINVVYFSF